METAVIDSLAPAPKEKRRDQKSCRESGQHDFLTGARQKLTGWGKVCRDRQQRGVSRKARIARKREAA